MDFLNCEQSIRTKRYILGWHEQAFVRWQRCRVEEAVINVDIQSCSFNEEAVKDALGMGVGRVGGGSPGVGPHSTEQ